MSGVFLIGAAVVIGVPAGIGALIAHLAGHDLVAGTLIGGGSVVGLSLALCCVGACAFYLAASCAYCLGCVKQIFRKRERVAKPPMDFGDLESQRFRIISLSCENDIVVGTLVSGEELFRIEQRTDTQAEVFRADLAKALRTKTHELMLYERERCLSESDMIQDVSVIIVKQALGQHLAYGDKTATSHEKTITPPVVAVKDGALAPIPETMPPGGIPTLLRSTSAPGDKTPAVSVTE
jgi:hypothetical protein